MYEEEMQERVFMLKFTERGLEILKQTLNLRQSKAFLMGVFGVRETR